MSDKSFRDELAFEAFKAQLNVPDFLRRLSRHELENDAFVIAECSYKFADAMLKERMK